MQTDAPGLEVCTPGLDEFIPECMCASVCIVSACKSMRSMCTCIMGMCTVFSVTVWVYVIRVHWRTLWMCVYVYVFTHLIQGLPWLAQVLYIVVVDGFTIIRGTHVHHQKAVLLECIDLVEGGQWVSVVRHCAQLQDNRSCQSFTTVLLVAQPSLM